MLPTVCLRKRTLDGWRDVETHFCRIYFCNSAFHGETRMIMLGLNVILNFPFNKLKFVVYKRSAYIHQYY
jgi:hypothetical protein